MHMYMRLGNLYKNNRQNLYWRIKDWRATVTGDWSWTPSKLVHQGWFTLESEDM